ncbi:hypothetical protein BJ322DRAFT_1211665 [Thelephora terrestris]|uniref:Uncharacterized protein n=1 Tax=Thelephora terrestris TaxID=56493 RepID=A0A9P6HBH9_9AGAM|nr:hypothetical protein BJ322DRAFT_1211665 [Thelephora terrestris]
MVFPPSHRQSPGINAPTHDTSPTVASKKQEETDQPKDLMAASDTRDHLEGLRAISSVASRLFILLGQQITLSLMLSLFERAMILCDVADLKARAKSQRDDLKISLDLARKAIEASKAGFWAKHGVTLEAGLRTYVQKKINERVKAEIEKQLERYASYLKNNEAKKRELTEVSELSHARLQNSLLRLQYPTEPVTWIGNLPEGLNQGITFGQLISADATSVLNLAKTLGLSPTPEDDRLSMLNRVMQHLGIGYKGIPSHTGILLMPIKTTP